MINWLLLILAGLIHSLGFASNHLDQGLSALPQFLSFSFLTYWVFTAKSKRQAFLKAWVFGICSFSASLYWLFISMHTYGQLPSLLAAGVVFLFAVYLSFYYAVAGALLSALKFPSTTTYRYACFNSLLWASLITLAELARGYFFTGFPWNAIGYAYLDTPLTAWAPIGGMYTVCFVVALLSALLAQCFIQSMPQKQVRCAMTLAGVFLFSVVLSLITWSSPTGTPMPIRLVQTNTDQAIKFDGPHVIERLYEDIELGDLPNTSAGNSAKVVIFPETTLPYFQNSLSPAIWNDVINTAASASAHFILGAPLNYPESNGKMRITNGLVDISWKTHVEQFYNFRDLPHYEKHHLVPFGEFIPTGFHQFVNAMKIPLSDFNRGAKSQSNLHIEDQSFSPSICYEDLFGEEMINSLFSSNTVGRGATILINISNLAWFGDTVALYQHLQISRMRAIEFSRPMVTSSNTGITASIDHNGHILAQLKPMTRGVLDVIVQGQRGLTPYTYTGNIPIALLSLVLLALALVKIRQRATTAKNIAKMPKTD